MRLIHTINRFTPHLVAVLGWVLLVPTGCTLDDPATGDKTPALTLQASKDYSVVHLSWEQVKVTGFKEYIILQSVNDIPDAPTPQTSQDISILTRIQDGSVTSFESANVLFSTRTCYKLYCDIGDRFLYSSTLCTDTDIDLLDGFFDRSNHEPGQSTMVAFDRFTTHLVVYDLHARSFTSLRQESVNTFPLLDVATYQNMTSLFTFDQFNNLLRKYSYPGLEYQNQRFISEGTTGGVVKGAFVYVMTQNNSAAFQILNQNNLTLIDSKAGSISTRNLAVFEGDTTIVLNIEDGMITRYLVNSSGKIIQTQTLIPGVSQLNTQGTCDISSMYYVGGRLGTLINREGDIIKNLATGFNEFTVLSRFSQDESKALLLTQDNITLSLNIYDLSALPAAPLIRKITLPSASYTDMFSEDDVIYVIGLTFTSGSNQTFILRFPL